MLRWFRKKPNEKLYPERIYEALADGEIGDMTAEKLRLPKETRARYGEKTLHYREAVTLCALMDVADKGCDKHAEKRFESYYLPSPNARGASGTMTTSDKFLEYASVTFELAQPT